MSEADIHFEFYRHLQNEIDDQPQRQGIKFGQVKPEYGDGLGGFADIVIFDSNGDPTVVIEAKAPDGSNRSRREIDPYAPKVIRQAFRYAGDLGAPYFATFNGTRLVIFDAYEEGVPLLQRSTKSYEISSLEKFAGSFLDEIARIQAGEAYWDADDEAFVNRVKSIHEKVSPELDQSLTDSLETDTQFRNSFLSWTAAQGFEYEQSSTDERKQLRREFAEQAAYLLINKIIFYKLLESSPTYGDEIESLAVSPFRVQDDLQEYFDHVVEKIDFEAVFEHDEVFDEIPLEQASSRIRDFIIELDDQNLQQFDSDVIGRIYEGVIPAERRHDLGEYYTPPAICDLITRLTIDDPNDTVLDPGCGSGGFLVSAYHRKQELLPETAGSHERILNDLYGIDINRFPAHLTAINLAIQDLDSYTEQVNIEVNDFFKVDPKSKRLGRETAGASGEKSETGVIGAIGSVDAVVGNPPYIRQENIKDKDAVREHLSNVDGQHLSKRSDIYSYFITHATQFLENGGRLGFITSDRWLDTSYGEDLQEFILDNYRIEAIVKFSRQAFSDALIGSCILILKREQVEESREENVAKYIRLNESIDIGEISSIVESDEEPNQMVRTENYRLVTRHQFALREEEKWSVFFNAPAIYFDLVGNNQIIELDEIAEVTRGFTSGANDFFYKRLEVWKELGLEEYTKPLLKATGQIDSILFDEIDAQEWAYLNINYLIKSFETENESEYVDNDKEERIKYWLLENGHEDLVEYIEWGEDQGFHSRPTVSNRDVWYNLGEHNPPPIIMTDFTWRIHRVVWNEAGALGSNQFYYIIPDEDINSKLLCGILNSRLTWLMCELKGRWAEGQGMARSRLMVYETEKLPIINPRDLDTEKVELIIDRFERLMEEEKKSSADDTHGDIEVHRSKLDKAILSSIGMDDRFRELKDAVDFLVGLREQAAGEETDVLVTRPSEQEVIELEGVARSRESKTLDEFSN